MGVLRTGRRAVEETTETRIATGVIRRNRIKDEMIVGTPVSAAVEIATIAVTAEIVMTAVTVEITSSAEMVGMTTVTVRVARVMIEAALEDSAGMIATTTAKEDQVGIAGVETGVAVIGRTAGTVGVADRAAETVSKTATTEHQVVGKAKAVANLIAEAKMKARWSPAATPKVETGTWITVCWILNRKWIIWPPPWLRGGCRMNNRKTRSRRSCWASWRRSES